MEKLGSIVFLVCFAVGLVGIAMGLVIRGAGALCDLVACARARRDGGWVVVRAPPLFDALRDTGITLGRRAKLHDAHAKGDLHVARYHKKSAPGADSNARSRRLLIVRRTGAGPLGVVRVKQGGMLESAALGAASAAGASLSTPDGWEWAIVSAPGAWLDVSRSEAVRALLAPNEHLHLGATHAVLSLPAGPLAPLLETAEARADALRRALAEG